MALENIERYSFRGSETIGRGRTPCLGQSFRGCPSFFCCRLWDAKGDLTGLAGALPIWGEASANATNRVAAHHPPDAPPPPKEPPPPPDFLELLPLSELDERELEPDRNHFKKERRLDDLPDLPLSLFLILALGIYGLGFSGSMIS